MTTADEAKAICASCAVRQSCLEYSLAAREREGVWGGLTERERRRIVRQRRKSRLNSAFVAQGSGPRTAAE